MKSLFFVIVLCLFISSINTQGYVFQRVIECENGQFELVGQGKGEDINDVKIDTLSEKTLSKGQKVRCKKWVHSYKVIQQINSHLRKQQQQQQQHHQQQHDELSQQQQQTASKQHQHLQPYESVLRALLSETSKQIIGDEQKASIYIKPQAYSKRGSRSRSSSSSSSSSKNNEQKFLSLYMTLNMQQNTVIYQGS